MRKMKDVRGVHVAAVKGAIFKVFRLQAISNKRKNASDIANWKMSQHVKECYNKIYADNENAIENIAKYAFPNITRNDDSFDNIYAYTASVCDIVLNPDYPDLECAKKPVERRFRKFKVFIFVN